MNDTDDVEHELDEGAGARTFQQILVDDAVDEVFTEDLAADCWKRQLTVLVDAPNEAWAERALDRIETTIKTVGETQFEDEFHPRPYTFRRLATIRTRSKDDFVSGEILKGIHRGRSLIGVFAPTSDPLPLFTDRPDVRLELRRPGGRAIARALQAATGQIVDPDELTCLDSGNLDGLAFVIRPRASASETLARLHAFARPSLYGDEVPDLRTFAAYGAAREWALAALRTVERLRSGDPTVGLADLPRGVLLVGPPGVGKTLFAKVLAKTLGLNAVLTSASDWLASGDSHLGAVIKAMRTSVEQARASAPSILFVDECDSIVDRDLEGGNSVSWWLNFVNAVLSSLDGVVRNRGVIIVGACNNVDRVDKALRRSGRMERVISLSLPIEAERRAILAHYLRSALEDDDLRILARRSDGRTGADLERAVREAKALAADAGRPIALQDMLDVLSPRTLAGEALRMVAVHEAGHALAAVTLGIEVQEVDVDARVTRLSKPASSMTRRAVDDHLTILMAGRAADEIFGGGARAGAAGSPQSDLGLATHLAAMANGSLGLGPRLSYRSSVERAAGLIENDRNFERIVESDLQGALQRARRLFEAAQQSARRARRRTGGRTFPGRRENRDDRTLECSEAVMDLLIVADRLEWLARDLRILHAKGAQAPMTIIEMRRS